MSFAMHWALIFARSASRMAAAAAATLYCLLAAAAAAATAAAAAPARWAEVADLLLPLRLPPSPRSAQSAGSVYRCHAMLQGVPAWLLE